MATDASMSAYPEIPPQTDLEYLAVPTPEQLPEGVTQFDFEVRFRELFYAVDLLAAAKGWTVEERDSIFKIAGRDVTKNPGNLPVALDSTWQAIERVTTDKDPEDHLRSPEEIHLIDRANIPGVSSLGDIVLRQVGLREDITPIQALRRLSARSARFEAEASRQKSDQPAVDEPTLRLHVVETPEEVASETSPQADEADKIAKRTIAFNVGNENNRWVQFGGTG